MKTGRAARGPLSGCLLVAAFLATACGSAVSRQELLDANSEISRVAAERDVGRDVDAGAARAEPESSGTEALPASAGSPSHGSPALGPSDSPRQSGAAVDRTQASGALARSGSAAKPGEAAAAAGPKSQARPSGGGGDSAAGALPGRPVTNGGSRPKGELRLGSIGTGSGPIGTAMRSVVDGAKAWASDVNARGGVNGHPVRLIFVDDGGDPTASLASAKRLVEQDKIQAFYATHSPTTEQAYVGYAEEKQVPIIGTCGCSNVIDASPMIFQVGPGAPGGASWAHVLPFTTLTDKRKVALLYCREAPVCPLLADGVKKGAKPAGYQVVYEGQISLAQPDFTAEMISARNAGADVVTTVADNATTVRVIRSARRQGYDPVFSTQQTANEDSFLQLGGGDVEGVILAAVVPDYANSPKLVDYRAAMDRYVPGGRKGSFSAQTWGAGKLIEVAGGALGDEPTSAQILAGLYGLKGETLGGLVPPMTFARGQGHGDVNQCIIPSRIEGGKFVYPMGDRFSCAPGWKPVGS